MKYGSIWKHKKRDTIYFVTGLASMQIGHETLCRAVPGLEPEYAAQICAALEKMTLVGYRSITGTNAHVRPKDEFCDGRFEEMKS